MYGRNLGEHLRDIEIIAAQECAINFSNENRLNLLQIGEFMEVGDWATRAYVTPAPAPHLTTARERKRYRVSCPGACDGRALQSLHQLWLVVVLRGTVA